MSSQPDHGDRAHAEFGPSSLKYVFKCTGYHGREGTNPAAEMGTRIHEALEVRDPSALQTEQEVGIYERIILDEDEVFASVYGGTEGVTILREERLELELNSEAKTPTFGTSDIVAFKDDIGLLIDYKTGISHIDPVRDNWQAIAYSLGTFQKYPELMTIHFAFLIPQRNETLLGTFLRSEVETYKSKISQTISQAEVIRPQWQTGAPDLDCLTPSVNCRFCRHEGHCPALGAVAIKIAVKLKPDLLFDAEIDPSKVDDAGTVEQLFAVAKIVSNWADTIKGKATQMAKDGVEFDTLKLRSMGANKVVVNKAKLVQLAIDHGMTVEEVLEAADLSPNKLGAALAANAERGSKGTISDQFIADAMSLGAVEVGTTRYTLSSR